MDPVALVRAYVKDAAGSPHYWAVNPAGFVAGKAILEASPEDQIAAVTASYEFPARNYQQKCVLDALRRQLFRRKLPWSAENLAFLGRQLRVAEASSGAGLVALVEKLAAQHGQTPALAEDLGVAAERLRSQTQYPNSRTLASRLMRLIGGDRLPLSPSDVWSQAAIADLDNAPAEVRQAWAELLQQASSATSARPTARWIKTAASLLAKLPEGDFRERLLRWLPLVDERRPGHDPRSFEANHLDELNSDILKGLVWCAAQVSDRDLTRAIGRLAISATRKIPGVGPRTVKVVNACIYALGQIPDETALGQLAWLKMKIKSSATQKEIDKALSATAVRLGVSREEIEEMGAPAYGLTEVGRLVEPLGDYVAELTVGAAGKCDLQWRKADGKLQKSVPAAIKADFAEDLKEIKGSIKDIEKMLPAQRDRLDGLFLEQKQWPVGIWRERYLDHPLVGVLAQRLLWRFTQGDRAADGIWHDGRIVDVDDQPLPWIDDEGTTVEIWHPIGRPPDDVLAWRGWLERHEVRQPFKQAHREVYLLTDAERRTGTYSNRFAAHILRQHQFNALCGVRGWRNSLRLLVDADYSPPTKSLSKWNLRAEFWVEGLGDDYGTDTTDSGVYRYISTDQVRFYPLDARQLRAHAGGGGYHVYGQVEPGEPLPLDVIPPLVFSEILRDVDLFVGVTSVGNDPAWADGGPDGRYRDYWTSYSFGDLSTSAQTRKEVLQGLIPRLKIADRCTFDDKFLIVQGSLRGYKIHLGSGNILMTPNDQYLCIVPKSSDESNTGKVFLPFEGDRTLSIILSKALLLADDAKIKDSTIVSQIRQ